MPEVEDTLVGDTFVNIREQMLLGMENTSEYC